MKILPQEKRDKIDTMLAEGFTHKQIAEKLGVSTSAVYNQAHRPKEEPAPTQERKNVPLSERDLKEIQKVKITQQTLLTRAKLERENIAIARDKKELVQYKEIIPVLRQMLNILIKSLEKDRLEIIKQLGYADRTARKINKALQLTNRLNCTKALNEMSKELELQAEEEFSKKK